MRKIAQIELLEIFDASRPGEKPQIIHNPLEAFDGRAQLMIALIKSWGSSTMIGDAMRGVAADCNDKPSPPPTVLSDFVVRCAEITQMTYDELERRGWMTRVPPLGDE